MFSFSTSESVICIVIGLLWVIQILLFFLIYHRINHEAKARGLFIIAKKAASLENKPAEDEVPKPEKRVKKAKEAKEKKKNRREKGKVDEVPTAEPVEKPEEATALTDIPKELSVPTAPAPEHPDLFSAFGSEEPADVPPNTIEKEPMTDNNGFVGDLFGHSVPRKQPSSNKKHSMPENARQGVFDELIIGEKELRNTPESGPLRLRFADDHDSTPGPEHSDVPMLSVIVVACNQGNHLRQNLPALLEQEYPNYEVIVIDDNSNDDTTDILQYLQTRHPHLLTRVTPATARRISRRKLSLMLGIKAAQGEWLVFTEADCCPVSSHWLSTMARQLPSVDDALTSDVDAVIGYTAFAPGKNPGSWLRRYDNMMRNTRLLGLALSGHAHMAYGSNLLYRRELFFEGKGYSAHLDLERGEDDLFVNENISPRRIRAEIDSKAVVVCTDNNTHRRTIEYLGRIATGRRLHGIMPHILRADTVTRALYAYATLAAIIWTATTQAWTALAIVVALWIVRYLLQWIGLRRQQTLFGEANYAPWIPLFELVHPLWEIRLQMLYLFTPDSAWHRKTI